MLLLLLACNGETEPPGTEPTDSEPAVVDSPTESDPQHTGETGKDSEPKDSEHSDPPDTGELWAGTPRIVLFIGDGMGFEHVEGGGLYANGSAGTLSFESMEHQGRIQTASLTGTTDSAASATAMATGHKTINGRLGKDQAGQDVESLVELARDKGMSIGIVTTDKVTGATPSAFLVHTMDRGDTDGIVSAVLADPPDVMLGGGSRYFEDLGEDIQSVSTADELAALVPDGRPVFGLFADGEIEYTLFKAEDSTEPTLAEMTSAAMTLLKDDPDGYFLMVEGARIDHASHGQMPEAVHVETARFSDAVQVVLDQVDDEAVVMVTADHECGGLHLDGTTTDEGFPGTEYLWGLHTNDDVGVWAQGPRTQWLHDERRQNVWIHAVLQSVIEGTAIVEPSVPKLIDGDTREIGSAVTTQTHATSHTHNQLDGLRVATDGEGLHVGLDGVFDEGMTPILLIDVDLGDGTGFASDNTLGDFTGGLDSVLSTVQLDVQVDGLGFELAAGGLDARPVDAVTMDDLAGLRGVGDPWVNEDDLYWLNAVTAFDHGNFGRHGQDPTDAGSVGTTEGGWEILVPWGAVYDGSLPADGLEIGLVALIVNTTGTDASNQVLPALSSSTAPGSDAITIEKVVHISIDGTGVATTSPALYP